MGDEQQRPPLSIGRLGSFDHVRLDAQERRNALSLAMLDELTAVVSRSAADDDARGLILDHAGNVFCAGVDLVERRTLPPDGRSHSEALADLYRALMAYPKPVVCRVDGAVRGGGLGLVLLADVTIATARASFAFTEVRVGVAPALVGALAMAKCGAGRLVPWLYSGAVFGAVQAAEVGLVTEVADDDGVIAVEAWSNSIGQGAPRALEHTKSLARRFGGDDLEDLMDEMVALSASLFDTDEAREGMAAFAEKRPPAWSTQSAEL